MKIKVTEKHIKNGRRGKPESCAIALAVKEAIRGSCLPSFFPGVTNGVKVIGDCIEVGSHVMSCGKKINRFVSNFDDDKKSVKPFSFNLKFD